MRNMARYVFSDIGYVGKEATATIKMLSKTMNTMIAIQRFTYRAALNPISGTDYAYCNETYSWEVFLSTEGIHNILGKAPCDIIYHDQ